MSNINSRHSNIEFIPAICPSCGGELRIPENRETIKCMYCGVNIVLRTKKTDQGQSNIETIFNLGLMAFEGKNYTEAYRNYSKALKIDHTNLYCWAFKGLCSAWLSDQKTSRFDEAIHCIQEAIRLGLGENTKHFSIIIQNFADSVYAYTNLVISYLNNEYEEQKNALGTGTSRFDIHSLLELQKSLTNRFFSEYGEPINKSVYFLWETLPTPIVARKIQSIDMIFLQICMTWWYSLDDRFTRGITSPRFLSSLLTTIKASSSDPFGEKAQAEELKNNEEELKKKRIESDPSWKRYYEETKYDNVVGPILKEIIQKYHPNYFNMGQKIETVYNPVEGCRIWFLVGKEGEIHDHASDYKKGSLLGIWLIYDKNNQAIGFEFYRRGYGIQRCGSSEKELRASLFALEETEKQKHDAEKARLEAGKIKQQALENEERLRKSMLLEWERLPWWKKMFTERPN